MKMEILLLEANIKQLMVEIFIATCSKLPEADSSLKTSSTKINRVNIGNQYSHATSDIPVHEVLKLKSYFKKDADIKAFQSQKDKKGNMHVSSEVKVPQDGKRLQDGAKQIILG
ncbi:hypothetical protein Tco_1052757 [Tanacetum coccineum]